MEGNQLKVLICGVEQGVNCSFGHSWRHTSTLPYSTWVISSHLPVSRSHLCSVLVTSASTSSFSQVKRLLVEGLDITKWFYGLFFPPKTQMCLWEGAEAAARPLCTAALCASATQALESIYENQLKIR